MKQDKRRRDIKSKLIAAICMLLVSSIMMVSTTYAWFTLSTAPEVTGISTTVGANGNLEMALLPTSGDLADIPESAEGDSAIGGTFADANLTWGNLVSMKENNGSDIYGLDQIKLMPAALNAEQDAEGVLKLAATGVLKTPSYGSDGRVSSLDANTVATAKNEQGQFLAGGSLYGVRAVGVAASMTQRELDYRNYRSMAEAAKSNARALAGGALSANGPTIAQIAITHAVGSDTYTDADLAALTAVHTAIAGSSGALKSIEDAMRYSLFAMLASAAAQETVDDTAYETFMANNKDKTLAQLLENSEISSLLGDIPSWTATYADYQAAVTKMSDAGTALGNVTKDVENDATSEGNDAYSWSQIRSALTFFANPDLLVVNDMTVDEIQDNRDQFITNTSNNGFAVLIDVKSDVNGESAGIFGDMAEFVGDYDSSFTIPEVSVPGVATLPNVRTTMYAKDTDSFTGDYLSPLTAAATAAGAPSAGDNADAMISDYYGYIIDLAFRTNVQNANLQLQTDAVDRIYEGQNDASTGTMGGGATMTFKGTDGFTNANVLALMEHINVVFFNKETNEVYGIAKADTTTGSYTEGVDGVTAKLYLHEYTVTADANDKLTNLQVSELKKGQTKDENGAITGTVESDLTSMIQGQATSVSVLVYLYGRTVTNADVANAVNSMTGTLNLQFSTDAELDPMDYTPLISQTGASEATEPEESTEPSESTGG